MTLTLLLATNNPHKVEEFRSIFLPYDVTLQTPADLGLVNDVDESGNTYFENARLKAQAYWQEGQNMVLADDSGLEVNALEGAPGIHSHRFLPDPNATSRDRCLYLLEHLKSSPRPWRASFHCEVVLLTRQGTIFTSHGVCTGQIIPEFRGENGFGYDPIFLVDGTNHTMAELDPATKNQLSHRGKAVSGMIAQLGLPLREV
ncbi:MAG TPA: RdgB/HAM1 family non-canonical purine NTP pyrophosphatase [Anaerolineaceae bacterium]|nr:RdgB/HAM1 family non-canonical purine NTP pyrophosphatase [Anaerolineaceae bacterium]